MATVHPLHDDIRRVDGRVGTRAPSFISAITADVSSRNDAIVPLVLYTGGTEKFQRRELGKRGRGNISRDLTWLLTFTATTYSSSVASFHCLNRFYLAQIKPFISSLIGRPYNYIDYIQSYSSLSRRLVVFVSYAQQCHFVIPIASLIIMIA